MHSHATLLAPLPKHCARPSTAAHWRCISCSLVSSHSRSLKLQSTLDPQHYMATAAGSDVVSTLRAPSVDVDAAVELVQTGRVAVDALGSQVLQQRRSSAMCLLACRTSCGRTSTSWPSRACAPLRMAFVGTSVCQWAAHSGVQDPAGLSGDSPTASGVTSNGSSTGSNMHLLASSKGRKGS